MSWYDIANEICKAIVCIELVWLILYVGRDRN
jgi:hypothetical protein